jgi:hypothetical protein
MEAAKILSDRENLDPDSLLAAQNALTASLGEIGTGVQAMGTTAANSMSAIGGTLSALQGQMNAMSNTIGNAGDNLGVEISDISDKDTEDNLTAKIEKCANFASVSADSNAGGIAGFNYANSASQLYSLAQSYGGSKGVIIASETASATNSRGQVIRRILPCAVHHPLPHTL